jgi:microcystin-dependent protein
MIMDPIIGQITLFAFGWIPYGWASCEGQTLNIMQNQALFSLLSINFGGNGSTTFNLPDLRGKVILGQGAPGYNFASSGGSAVTTLVANNIPSHTHAAVLTLTNATTTVSVNASAGTTSTPSSRANCIGALASDKGTMYNNIEPNVALNVAGNTVAGTVTVNPSISSNSPFTNMPPYCVLNASIALQGIYPQRQ